MKPTNETDTNEKIVSDVNGYTFMYMFETNNSKEQPLG
jgi:hypothetical protein